MIEGAPVTCKVPEEIGADGDSVDTVNALYIVEEILGIQVFHSE